MNCSIELSFLTKQYFCQNDLDKKRKEVAPVKVHAWPTYSAITTVLLWLPLSCCLSPCHFTIAVVLTQKLPPHPTTIPATLSHPALISATSSILLELQQLPHHCACCHLVAMAATVLKSPPPFCNCHYCFANALTFLGSPPPCCIYLNLFEISMNFLQPPPPCCNHCHLFVVATTFCDSSHFVTITSTLLQLPPCFVIDAILLWLLKLFCNCHDVLQSLWLFCNHCHLVAIAAIIFQLLPPFLQLFLPCHNCYHLVVLAATFLQ